MMVYNDQKMANFFRQGCTIYIKGINYAGLNLYRQMQERPMLNLNGKLETEKFISFIRNFMQDQCGKNQISKECIDSYYKYTYNIIEGVTHTFNHTAGLPHAINALLNQSAPDHFTHTIVRHTVLTVIATMFCIPRLITYCVELNDYYLRERAFFRLKKLRNFIPTSELNFRFCISMHLMSDSDPIATLLLQQGKRNIEIMRENKHIWFSDIYSTWHIFLMAYQNALKEKKIVDKMRPWTTPEQKVFNQFGVSLLFSYLNDKDITIFS